MRNLPRVFTPAVVPEPATSRSRVRRSTATPRRHAYTSFWTHMSFKHKVYKLQPPASEKTFSRYQCGRAFYYCLYDESNVSFYLLLHTVVICGGFHPVSYCRSISPYHSVQLVVVVRILESETTPSRAGQLHRRVLYVCFIRLPSSV